MDHIEFAKWTDWMESRRGTWTIDPIHNGIDRDLIAFLPDEDDETRGIIVTAFGSTIYGGTYTNAIPHIGDADMVLTWGCTILGPDEKRPKKNDNRDILRYLMLAPTAGAYKFIVERIGLAFLLGTACNVPARSVRRQ